MASSSPAHPDMAVTLKVSFQGTTRRLTLPLSEVSSFTLLDKIRHFLSISSESIAVFERHSDSAGAYVELDPDKTAVWKQLHRAAKAKRKLKLRVTLFEPEEEEEDDEVDEVESSGPKPVSVEDEPEPQAQPASTNDTPTIQSLESEGTQPALEKAMKNMQLGANNPDQELSPQGSQTPGPIMCGAPKRANFAVCCNHCDRTIPDAHYHCSTCDDGDFDLCPACVELGITCYNSEHWLLKRFVRGDFIVVSTTERVSAKPKVKEEEEPEVKKQGPEEDYVCSYNALEMSPPCQPFLPAATPYSIAPMRTCNSCVQELPDKEFLHCLSCDDFDLCKVCFGNDQHGHHPQHAFAPAVEGTLMSSDIQSRLAPGRNQRHHAICDGCDKFIRGIRHKCIDCPDWDYCADCVLSAGFVHPNHRFVPIYEQYADAQTHTATRPCHYGICCDGPLCNVSRKTYIVGERFKCAVCHDTDFCANCEASPANTHNKTHPLIKFKTPVRRVEVKTKGEDENGQKMPVMGDRLRPSITLPQSCAVQPVASSHFPTGHATASPSESSAAAPPSSPMSTAASISPAVLQLSKLRQETALTKKKVLDAKDDLIASIRREQQKGLFSAQLRARGIRQHPTVEKTIISSPQVMRQPQMMPTTQRQANALTTATTATPIAVFERDTIADGTVLSPNHVFEQTWVLRNGGDTPWPAGCSVKFVGGDYMGHVDSSHPAGIHDLVSASESTVCYDALAPGQEFPFTVLLRTPAREGKVISYWRLQSDNGLKFGHRLWCDVSVQKPKAVKGHQIVETAEVVEAPQESESAKESVTSDSPVEKSAASSQMIFPKLNSSENLPVSDMTHDTKDIVENLDYASPDEYDFETIDEDETWAEISDDGVLTDEDYDILDASDEEYINQQQKKTQK